MNLLRYWLPLVVVIPLVGEVFFEEPQDFHPKCVVVGCFLEYQDKILLLHRQDHTCFGNQWGVPGGKLRKMKP